MNSTKYFIKGTLTGTRESDYEMETINDIALLGWQGEIEELFTRNPDDELAQYIPTGDWSNNALLYGIVKEIWVGVKPFAGRLCSWTEVTCSEELNEEQKTALLNYLTGQFSDGYGEGLEQKEFDSYIGEDVVEEWDDEEQRCYMTSVESNVSMYLHLWNSEKFELVFVEPENYNPTQPQTRGNLVPQKPKCKLVGEDGNIFNLVGIASRSLRRAGLADKATEMSQKVMQCSSYSEALSIITEYVEVR